MAGVGIGRVTMNRPAATAHGIEMAFGEAMAAPDAHHIQLLSDDGEMRVPGVLLDAGQGFLAGNMLPDAGDGKTWQLWGEEAGQYVSLGVLGARPGLTAFSCGNKMPTKLLITKERAGGSASPESTPMLSALV